MSKQVAMSDDTDNNGNDVDDNGDTIMGQDDSVPIPRGGKGNWGLAAGTKSPAQNRIESAGFSSFTQPRDRTSAGLPLPLMSMGASAFQMGLGGIGMEMDSMSSAASDEQLMPRPMPRKPKVSPSALAETKDASDDDDDEEVEAPAKKKKNKKKVDSDKGADVSKSTSASSSSSSSKKPKRKKAADGSDKDSDDEQKRKRKKKSASKKSKSSDEDSDDDTDEDSSDDEKAKKKKKAAAAKKKAAAAAKKSKDSDEDSDNDSSDDDEKKKKAAAAKKKAAAAAKKSKGSDGDKDNDKKEKGEKKKGKDEGKDESEKKKSGGKGGSKNKKSEDAKPQSKGKKTKDERSPMPIEESRCYRIFGLPVEVPVEVAKKKDEQPQVEPQVADDFRVIVKDANGDVLFNIDMAGFHLTKDMKFPVVLQVKTHSDREWVDTYIDSLRRDSIVPIVEDNPPSQRQRQVVQAVKHELLFYLLGCTRPEEGIVDTDTTFMTVDTQAVEVLKYISGCDQRTYDSLESIETRTKMVEKATKQCEELKDNAGEDSVHWPKVKDLAEACLNDAGAVDTVYTADVFLGRMLVDIQHNAVHSVHMYNEEVKFWNNPQTQKRIKEWKTSLENTTRLRDINAHISQVFDVVHAISLLRFPSFIEPLSTQTEEDKWVISDGWFQATTDALVNLKTISVWMNENEVALSLPLLNSLYRPGKNGVTVMIAEAEMHINNAAAVIAAAAALGVETQHSRACTAILGVFESNPEKFRVGYDVAYLSHPKPDKPVVEKKKKKGKKDEDKEEEERLSREARYQDDCVAWFSATQRSHNLTDMWGKTVPFNQYMVALRELRKAVLKYVSGKMGDKKDGKKTTTKKKADGENMEEKGEKEEKEPMSSSSSSSNRRTRNDAKPMKTGDQTAAFKSMRGMLRPYAERIQTDAWRDRVAMTYERIKELYKDKLISNSFHQEVQKQLSGNIKMSLHQYINWRDMTRTINVNADGLVLYKLYHKVVLNKRNSTYYPATLSYCVTYIKSATQSLRDSIDEEEEAKGEGNRVALELAEQTAYEEITSNLFKYAYGLPAPDKINDEEPLFTLTAATHMYRRAERSAKAMKSGKDKGELEENALSALAIIRKLLAPNVSRSHAKAKESYDTLFEQYTNIPDSDDEGEGEDGAASGGGSSSRFPPDICRYCGTKQSALAKHYARCIDFINNYPVRCIVPVCNCEKLEFDDITGKYKCTDRLEHRHEECSMTYGRDMVMASEDTILKHLRQVHGIDVQQPQSEVATDVYLKLVRPKGVGSSSEPFVPNPHVNTPYSFPRITGAFNPITMTLPATGRVVEIGPVLMPQARPDLVYARHVAGAESMIPKIIGMNSFVELITLTDDDMKALEVKLATRNRNRRNQEIMASFSSSSSSSSSMPSVNMEIEEEKYSDIPPEIGVASGAPRLSASTVASSSSSSSSSAPAIQYASKFTQRKAKRAGKIQEKKASMSFSDDEPEDGIIVELPSDRTEVFVNAPDYLRNAEFMQGHVLHFARIARAMSKTDDEFEDALQNYEDVLAKCTQEYVDDLGEESIDCLLSELRFMTKTTTNILKAYGDLKKYGYLGCNSIPNFYERYIAHLQQDGCPVMGTAEEISNWRATSMGLTVDEKKTWSMACHRMLLYNALIDMHWNYWYAQLMTIRQEERKQSAKIMMQARLHICAYILQMPHQPIGLTTLDVLSGARKFAGTTEVPEAVKICIAFMIEQLQPSVPIDEADGDVQMGDAGQVNRRNREDDEEDDDGDDEEVVGDGDEEDVGDDDGEDDDGDEVDDDGAPDN
jgi:hypothetical protein